MYPSGAGMLIRSPGFEKQITHKYPAYTLMMDHIVLLILSFLSTTLAANVNYCQNLSPIHDFDEDAVLGMWYVHEYVYHKENATRTDVNSYCPIVQFRKFEDYVEGGLLNHNLVSVCIYFNYDLC